MKIQVGKTYKDRSDAPWLIEVKLVNPSHTWFPFLGTCKNGHLAYFNEDGQCYTNLDYTLSPNRVKKEAWGWKYIRHAGATVVGTRDAAEQAVSLYPKDRVLTKIIWEEEEA